MICVHILAIQKVGFLLIKCIFALKVGTTSNLIASLPHLDLGTMTSRGRIGTGGVCMVTRGGITSAILHVHVPKLLYNYYTIPGKHQLRTN